MSAKPKYYWDACIFFAWLNNEEAIHGTAVIDGIVDMAKQYDDNTIVLMSALATKTEVFDFKLKTQYARDEFSKRFQRDNFLWILADERVTDKSRSLRDFHAKKGVTLDANDCIHLAAAIVYKADVLYTLDGNSPTPKPNSLLLLDGHAGYPPIKKPFKAQGSLFTGVPVSVSSAVSPIPPGPKRKTGKGPGRVH